MYCVLEAVRSDYSLDLARIAKFMRQDTVIRSWLLEIPADALPKNAQLERIRGWPVDAGEGRWTVRDAIYKDVALAELGLSIFTRFRLRVDAEGAGALLNG